MPTPPRLTPIWRIAGSRRRLSAFAAVRKLPPATHMVLDETGVRSERYWRLDFAAKRRFASPAERNEEIRSQIRRAVGRRMIADVPLGAFLSGGVDSSAVVAAMAEQSSEPVRTFSIGFTHDEYNELPQARLVAERFATEHHEYRGGARRGRDPAADRPPLRRAVRRPLGGPQLLRGRDGAPGGHGSPQRRRGR